MNDLLDNDGYPTEYSLTYIKEFSYENDYNDLLNFVKEIWHMSEWGFRVEEYIPTVVPSSDKKMILEKTVYKLSTGGWSGNEDIISALQSNMIFWSTCWVSSRRGGHYEFEVKEYTHYE